MQEGFFTASDNARLHYMNYGKGEPIVLLSGFSLPCTCWSKNIEALAQHYKVCTRHGWQEP